MRLMSPSRIKNVYVIGHTTPDTDSVCSAIAYAYFKNITDKRYVFTPVAGRQAEPRNELCARTVRRAPFGRDRQPGRDRERP